MASVISTTGYVSADYSLWGGLAETLFFCAMMICGCSGSTAGGPKVFRYQLLLDRHRRRDQAAAQPERGGRCPRFQGQPVSDEVMGSVIAFMMLFFLTLGLGAVALVLLGSTRSPPSPAPPPASPTSAPASGPRSGPAATSPACPTRRSGCSPS